MNALSALLVLSTLAACSNGETLPVPRGPVFALNAGHWQPIPADLQPPKLVHAE